MASLVEIRRAAAQTIKNYAEMELATYDTVEDLVETPAIIVEPLSADFTVAMQRGGDTWEFHIYVLVGRASPAEAQHILDALVDGTGPNSIRQIIYDHGNLGLGDAITDSIITSVRGYGGSFDVAKIPHIGAVLKLRVETGAA